MRTNHPRRAAAVFAFLGLPLLAQTTTNFTATVTLGQSTPNETYGRNFIGTGSAGALGNAVLQLNTFQPLGDDYNSGVGQMGSSLTLAFNRLDRIVIANAGIPDPSLETITVTGRVTNGSGAYANATGPAGGTRLTLTRTSTSPLRYRLALTGTGTAGGQTLNLALADAEVEQDATIVNVFDVQNGNAAFTPFGNASVSVQSHPNSNRWDNVSFIEVNLTFTFSETDSIQAFFIVDVKDGGLAPRPGIFTGGSGKFAGASGTFRITSLADSANGTTAAVEGTVVEAGPATPVITSVNTASGSNPISPNDWIEIKGANLVPRETPAGGLFWSDAPEFAQGRMPTALGDVSVTVNGKPAYIWWYCSAATTPACATDQINVLTTLDDYTGEVPIVVKNGSQSSAAFARRSVPATPAFLLFSTRGDVVATHSDGSIAGPAALFPGVSTPARAGETISFWATGFGLPATPLVEGASQQSGELPDPLACTLGKSKVSVASALVSPGLYQFNVTIPATASTGDNYFWCTYGNTVTPLVLITLQ
jgi:uncharacterized protein (TIGR03437 family)